MFEPGHELEIHEQLLVVIDAIQEGLQTIVDDSPLFTHEHRNYVVEHEFYFLIFGFGELFVGTHVGKTPHQPLLQCGGIGFVEFLQQVVEGD